MLQDPDEGQAAGSEKEIDHGRGTLQRAPIFCIIQPNFIQLMESITSAYNAHRDRIFSPAAFIKRANVADGGMTAKIIHV